MPNALLLTSDDRLDGGRERTSLSIFELSGLNMTLKFYQWYIDMFSVAKLVGEGYEKPSGDDQVAIDVNYAKIIDWMVCKA